MTESFNDLKFSTLVDLLRYRALHQPCQLAFTFLQDGETEEASLTYQALDQQAQAIAALLQSFRARGERALLLYPPGVEFISAFCGCLYSGVIAIPAPPPDAARLKRTLPRLQAIANDAQASFVLTTSRILSVVENLRSEASEFQAMRWLATEKVSSKLAAEWKDPIVSRDTLAYLQYTSGSTSTPKGVMVRHGNLMHHSAYISQAWGYTSDSIAATWMPYFHDYGLVDGLIQPLYKGIPCYVMSPLTFIKRPSRWLQTISRYKVTHSQGPNFAYDHCVRRIAPQQYSGLDLSSWRTASNGAEPIRKQTLERFVETFEPFGFRWSALYPAYGLAEATLLVSTKPKMDMPVFCTVSASALQQNQIVEVSEHQQGVQTLVGCGHPIGDMRVVIVHPETLSQCVSNEVGEIWVSDPSVALGYWNRIEETERTFRAYLADTGEGPFLRTGDLGFLKEGELFVTGRLKDLIVIRGRNHYPQDIELTIEQSHPAMRLGCGAAFSVDVDGEERLVIAQEVEREYLQNLDTDAVVRNIRQAVVEQHELDVHAILLLKSGSILKTSSGKIQRHACQAEFLAGSLNNVVWDWTTNPQSTAKFRRLQVDVESLEHQLQTLKQQRSFSGRNNADEQASSHKRFQKAEAIQAWLAFKVSEQVGVNPHDIDVREPFANYALNSLAAVSLSGELEDWLGCRLSPTLLYDYPTIEAVARHLAEESDVSGTTFQVNVDHSTGKEAIAIISLGCRFPYANDTAAFWQVLRNGVDAITEVPAARWDINAFYNSDPAALGKMSTRWGGFLEQVDQFDPHFFGIAPREAEQMDPQQRLLLEVAWEALENAGQAPDKLAGSQTGVFIGISTNDYSRFQFGDFARIDAHVGTGHAFSIAANRLSYLLDLRGPSLAVDTACSSSLVAVHLACQSLRDEESNMALVGGVNLILSPELTITFSQARMMAADGRCKTFDAGADGYVRGEGCGMVVLKRLSDALRDGDNILALIRGSAVNQDGRSNGLTAPNGPSQQAVIRQALKNAGVKPAQLSYVESHGTGTPLGDPIEFESLKTLLMQGRSQDQPCAIGSVKTNIGHLEAAAGIAGLIKVVLSLQHREIPPHLHLKQLNPYISLEGTPFSIPTVFQPWPTDTERRFAGVSSFGFGGTNAHVVVEEAPVLTPEASDIDLPLHLLALSAKSEGALKELARRYKAFLAAHPTTSSFADVCFTTNTGRSHFAHRLAVTAESTVQMGEQLDAFTTGSQAAGLVSGQVQSRNRPKIAFLFTGQGSQYVDMGRQLYETQPTFRKTLERCAQLLRPYFEQPLLSVLYPAPNVATPLNETAYTQPALFALEYSLAELWRSWGIVPDAVMGHSVGEYVAACVAGVFSLEDGLKLIAERSRLMQALPKNGQMAAVFANEERVIAAITPFAHDVTIAGVNGPENIVISGVRFAVHAVLRHLEAEGVKTKLLNVSHAFHSPLMQPMLTAFEHVAVEVEYFPVRTPLISNVTGQLVNGEEVSSARYWCRHVREPVRFLKGMQALHEQGYRVFMEIGPSPVLLGMGRQCLPEAMGSWLPSLRRDYDDWQQLLESLGTLYVHGVPVDWSGFHRDYLRHRVLLPNYPFQRQRYWFEASEPEHRRKVTLSRNGVQRGALHPLLRQWLHSPIIKETIFESQLSTELLPFLVDHQVYGTVVLPATAYVEMVLAAAKQAFGSNLYVLEEVIIQEMLILPQDYVRTVQLILTPEGSKVASFQIFSLGVGEENEPTAWRLHATGKVRIGQTEIAASVPLQVSLEAVRARCQEEVSVGVYYQRLRERGLEYGTSFQGLEKIWRRDEEALGQIRLPELLMSEAVAYQLHPALLDACFQLLATTLPGDVKQDTYLPISLESLRVYGQTSTQLWCHALLCSGDGLNKETLAGNLYLFDEAGQVVVAVEGLHIKRVRPESLLRIGQQDFSDWLYEIEWQLKSRLNQELRRFPLDYMPTPLKIAQCVQPQIPRLSVQHRLEVYQELLPQLDALSVAYVLRAVQQLGWELRLHQRVSVASLAQQLGVANQHHRLLGRMLEMLEEEGFLKKADFEWEVCRVTDVENPQERWKALSAQYTLCEAELSLLGRCGHRLADVLRGAYNPLHLLFPEGSLTTSEKLYQDSPLARVNNSLVQEAISTALERLPKGRTVRILEIGAGTGGTTAYVLSMLPANQTNYVFTDVSHLFTSKAEQKFRDYPFVQYQILDIEQDPEGQGFIPHQFDVILAANVLHATADLRKTLRHVQQLLAPEGLLVLLEVARPQRWLDLIFGLTEGWWKFTDLDLRPSYPLLSQDKWRNLLEERGFTEAVSLPQKEDGDQDEPAQIVILARGPVIKQPPQWLDSAFPIRKQQGSWLIFTDGGGVGQHLAELLRTRGERCILVSAGKTYEILDEGRLSIDPLQPQGFQRLLRQALGSDQSPCRGVVHLWSLENAPVEETTVASLDAAQALGCGSVLHLVQALAQGWSEPPRLWLVTQGVQPIGLKPAALAVSQSPVWGLGRVVALENPEVWGGLIDLDSDAVEEQAAKLLEEIWEPDGEDHLAFRRGQRYVARLVCNKAEKKLAEPLCLQADGTYLITGGLGGLGLKVARWMVEQGARHLVLVGRSSASSNAREALSELEQMGVQVVIAQADVSEEGQIASVLTGIAQSLPPLRGVIHAAGVLDDGVLVQQDWERFTKVMAPKMKGAWNLHVLTRDMPLDFFVLFSSMASLLGSRGQGNHAAANSFLDALAHARRLQGLPALSINWGVWSEVGAAAQRNADEWVTTQGMGIIAPQQGVQVLEHLLRQTSAQVGVMPIQWSKFIEQFAAGVEPPLLSEMAREEKPREAVEKSGQRLELLRRLEELLPSERQACLVTHVRDQVTKVLRLDPSCPLEPHQGFFEMGMDSLMAIELKNCLQTSLGRSLPSTVVFDYPTIDALAAYLVREVLSWEPTPPSSLESQQESEKLAMPAANLEGLSEEELVALFDSELATIDELMAGN